MVTIVWEFTFSQCNISDSENYYHYYYYYYYYHFMPVPSIPEPPSKIKIY
jgi:hypothetical protein